MDRRMESAIWLDRFGSPHPGKKHAQEWRTLQRHRTCQCALAGDGETILPVRIASSLTRGQSPDSYEGAAQDARLHSLLKQLVNVSNLGGHDFSRADKSFILVITSGL